MHGAQTKYLVSLPRQGRERGRRGGREGGREVLLLATDRCRAGGRNDLERSAPWEPASAAADSALKIGRTPDGFIYLAEEKPVCPLGCSGPFQTLPGLGVGEEGPSHSGKQNRAGAWGRGKLWQRMGPPLRSPPGCCGAGPSCPGPDQLLARPVSARSPLSRRVCFTLYKLVCFLAFCSGLGAISVRCRVLVGLCQSRAAKQETSSTWAAPPGVSTASSSAPHSSGLTAGSLCHSQSDLS